MILQELVREYNEVISEYEKNHSNYKKYKLWSIFCIIGLGVVPLIALAVCVVIDYFFHFISFTISPIFMFCLIISTSILLDYIGRRKLLLKESEIDNLYEDFRPILVKYVSIDSINYLIEMIDSELNTKTKSYITYLVIAGTLSLAIWQTFVTGAFDQDLPAIQTGLLLLGSVIVITIFIKFIRSLIQIFWFRIRNTKYDALEMIAYFVKEYRFEINNEPKISNEEKS